MKKLFYIVALLIASLALADGRWSIVLTDSDGTGQSGLSVQLYRQSDDVLLGAFSAGDNDGEYYIDYGVTEAVYIKVDGVKKTITDGRMFPGDDFISADTLASTKGAGKIGMADVGGYWVSTTLEAWSQEIGWVGLLSSTSSGYGGDDVGFYDPSADWTATTVGGALREIGPLNTALSGLTATASELNRLDGVSDSVTAATLNDLCDGSSTTDAHRHGMGQLALSYVGPHYQSDVGATNFIIYSGYDGEWNGDGPKGHIILSTYHADGSGRVYFRRGNDSEVQTDYLAISSYEYGDGDFSSSSGLAGVTTGTGAILRNSNRIDALQQASYAAGVTSLIIYSSGTSDSACSVPNETIKWTMTGSSTELYLQQAFICEPGMKSVKADLYAKKKTSGDAKVYLDVGSYQDQETVTGTDWTHYALAVSVPTVTSDSLMTVELSFSSDADELRVSEWIVIRASQ